MAWARKPMPRADVVVLRVRGDEPPKTPKWYNRREPLARRFRWDLDRVEWHSRHEQTRSRASILLYGFLTTVPNGVVAPIHPKAMPVTLTTKEECDVWILRAVG